MGYRVDGDGSSTQCSNPSAEELVAASDLVFCGDDVSACLGCSGFVWNDRTYLECLGSVDGLVSA
ncbi:MAG: hypothetical protein IJK78_05975 [Bacteroidales bacterium]|nr:hypothetical protein [Bacteroidales bacterium]